MWALILSICAMSGFVVGKCRRSDVLISLVLVFACSWFYYWNYWKSDFTIGYIYVLITLVAASSTRLFYLAIKHD